MSISTERMAEIIKQAKEAAWITDGSTDWMGMARRGEFSETVYKFTLDALVEAEKPANYPSYACPKCMKWIPAEHLEHDEHYVSAPQ